MSMARDCALDKQHGLMQAFPMKSKKPSHRPAPQPQEIELKLALPTAHPSGLAKLLAHTPVLARRKPVQLHLHNIYFDTPEQHLHQQRIALRLRRKGSDAKPEWLQTLKMGGRSDSALSQRGEWEVGVPGAELSWRALEATPWQDLDADGALFGALAPCLVTTFTRTLWQVRRRGGSVVEVALDIGQVTAGGKSTPICELELELLAGPPAALFEVAQQIARTLAVLPLNISKAERGYALLEDALQLPLRAQPPSLNADMPVPVAAQQVLREMFSQFTTNLHTLRTSDDPEVVHQARVGWRRFHSACRLFKPVLALDAVPDWQALKPLLALVGTLRDLDVARTDTLPPLADAYTAGDTAREERWQAMHQALTHAATRQRQQVRAALEVPAVGAALLNITQWLEALADLPETGAALKPALRRWARQRIARLHQKLKRALKDVDDPQSQHRARIFSKRLRYGIEALQPLLPKRTARRWHAKAVALQTGIGTARDLLNAAALAAYPGKDAGLAEFLRGVAVGQQRRK